MQIANSLAVPCAHDKTVVVETREDIARLARMHSDQHTPYVLGGATNVVLGDIHRTVILNRHTAPTTYQQQGASVLVSVASGVVWDEVVALCTARGWWGIENLAAIPGTMGGAVVQNIGAYGAELADTCQAVEVFDMATARFRILNNAECAFGYRTSVFHRARQTVGDRLIVVAATLRLRMKGTPNERYIAMPNMRTPDAIAAHIRAVRAAKLPDPATTPNAGSFFKNPILSEAEAHALKARLPDAPLYPVPDQKNGHKTSTAHLIEAAGLKGYQHADGGLVSAQHALVLTNPNRVSGAAIWRLAEHVQTTVWDAFGVRLTPEVRYLRG